MARTIFLLFSLFVAAHCDQLSILYSPKAVEFRGNARLDAESLPDVFGAALGYSVAHPTEWDGLTVKDPFNMANGVVVVVAEGIDSLNIEDSHSFELYGGSGSEAVSELMQKSADHHSISFEIDLKESADSFSTPLGSVQPDDDEVKPQYLKPKSNKADADFLRQIAFINGLSDLLVTSTDDNIPAVHIVRVSLEALLAAHEPTSHAVMEAKKLLANALLELQTAAEKAFDGAVVVGLVTSTEAPLVRSKRQASTPKQEEADNQYNFAKKYDSTYPVIFNIILWFSVVLVFSLLAISISIATMDPGRDSIIYRMTSTRMKKDN